MNHICRYVRLVLAGFLTGLAGQAVAQIVSPAPGVQIPQVYYDTVARTPRAYQFQKAWIDKTNRAKRMRDTFQVSRGPDRFTFESLPQSVRRQMTVGGTLEVPVIMVDYANRFSAPRTTTTLQQKLFDGPNATGTMSDLYAEMSYGNLVLSGTVYGVVPLSQNDTYYEGTPPNGNGISCLGSKTGELIMEALDAVDGSVDFGSYDNDGPDGIPNSGDDDGFVDFVAFVHPEKGGECGNTNMWSHRWVVGAWPTFGSDCVANFGTPYTTDDPATGGGNIQVWDYTIQPLIGSGSTGTSSDGCGDDTVEIGVFCHEFGHAFGLPDLYDSNGGFGRGVGRHTLMGAGNWNRPANPVHMNAWSKTELGWVIPQVVGPQAQVYTINDAESSGDVYKLDVMEEKFRRTDLNPIVGSYSLSCGLTTSEAASRGYFAGAGYGNMWNESIRRDFPYDGATHPVTLDFVTQYNLEQDYDFGYLKIRVNGTETTLRTYTGIGSDVASIDLTPYLMGSGAADYQLIFQMTSDESWSDEDGFYDSGSNGPFKIDQISVAGGGVSHATGLEQYEDGWYYDFDENPVTEFFLVENRNRSNTTFDQYMFEEGLYVWHIEQYMARWIVNDQNPNAGVSNPRLAYSVKLLEADGLEQLVSGASFGDAGDPYPGSSNNRDLDNSSTPSSLSHNGLATMALVTGVGNPGPQVTATMRGGHFPPVVSSIMPTAGDLDALIPIEEVLGSGFVHGATIVLSPPGAASQRLGGSATDIEWVGKNKLSGVLDLTGATPGPNDVIVINPDGQSDTLAAAFTVNASGVFILSFTAEVTGSDVLLQWDIFATEAFQGFEVRRGVAGGASTPVHPGLLAVSDRSFTDDTAEAGVAYEYTLVVILSGGGELHSDPAAAQTPPHLLALDQNFPNPFNPSTTIGFSLPKPGFVSLTVYDAAGRRVRTLLNESRQAGPDTIEWDGRDDFGTPASSGVYFYRLESAGRVLTKKLVLLR